MTHRPAFLTVLSAFALLCLAALAPNPAASIAADLPGAPGTAGRTLDVRYKGLIVPSKQVLLVAPLDGIIAKIKIKKGDTVKANDVLAVMDDEIQKLVVEAAKLRADSNAGIRVAELAVDDAKVELDRAEDLLTKVAIGKFEVDKRLVIHKTKMAELVGAKEQTALALVNLKLEEAKLRKHSMLAPFDGTVMDIVTEEGATLARNDKVMALAALSVLEARINLPNSREIYEYMRGKVGMNFKMIAGKPVDREITGTLKLVREIIDPGSATFLCEFTIDNKAGIIAAGSTVDLIWPQEPVSSAKAEK